MKNIFYITLITVFASSCTMSNLRHTVGAAKQSPDEFMVETRQPLVVPKTFDLPNPQEAGIPNLERNNDAAKAVLFGQSGNTNAQLSKTEASLLQKTNATTVNGEVKKQVYLDHKQTAGKGVFGVKKGGFMEKVLDPFGYNAPHDPQIDVEAEKKRVNKAIREGKQVSGEDAIIKE